MQKYDKSLASLITISSKLRDKIALKHTDGGIDRDHEYIHFMGSATFPLMRYTLRDKCKIPSARVRQ